MDSVDELLLVGRGSCMPPCFFAVTVSPAASGFMLFGFLVDRSFVWRIHSPFSNSIFIKILSLYFKKWHGISIIVHFSFIWSVRPQAILAAPPPSTVNYCMVDLVTRVLFSRVCRISMCEMGVDPTTARNPGMVYMYPTCVLCSLICTWLNRLSGFIKYHLAV